MLDDQSVVTYTERMVPEEAHARIFWEHVARCRFTKDFAHGKTVLDIACGKGYGVAALAKVGALSVVGVDRSADICDHARRKYGIDARPGDAQAIPLSDRSIDLVVSFETIEHIDNSVDFLDECVRVLIPEGMLIVSTPNRPIYSSESTKNPFHRFEFDEGEFLDLLQARFRSVKLYTQFPQSAGWWSLRSLAAERSPWLCIKGFWRLSSWLCPAIQAHVSPAIRARTDEIILARHSFPSSLFDPYIVRRRSKSSRERPYILIAVAQGVR
jgi:SAM-dependent methyltransferase